MNADKKRLSNIELLKVLLMLGVVVLHYNNGNIGKAFSYVPMGSAQSHVLFFMESLFICAVNTFMLISGFFLCERKQVDLVRAAALLVQVVVYREVLYLIDVISAKQTFDITVFLLNLIPKSYFAVIYVSVYALAPFINKLLCSLDDSAFNKFLVVAVFVGAVWPYFIDVVSEITGVSLKEASSIGYSGSQSGYTMINFILMYTIGAMLRRNTKVFRFCDLLMILAICLLLLYGFSYGLKTRGHSPFLAWEYCNPVIILEAVVIFQIFRQIRLQENKWINSFAKATFSVYLLNETLIKRYVSTERWVTGNGFLMLMHLSAICIAIVLISWVTQIAWEAVTKPFFAYLGKHYSRYAVISAE